MVYKEMRDAGNDFINAVTALYKISNNEIYTEIACSISLLTQKYMSVARARDTKRENRKIQNSETEL